MMNPLKKKIIIFTLLFGVLASTASPLIPKNASAATVPDPGNLLSAQVLLDAGSMNVNQIQAFLSSKGGYLSSYQSMFDCRAYLDNGSLFLGNASRSAYLAVGAPCGQTVSAATIIYYVSQVYGVSPKVIMATIQKESSLITAGSQNAYLVDTALGYNCPDSGGCTKTAGSNFMYQLDGGAWTLRFRYERLRGNTGYWPSSTSTACTYSTRYYSPSLYPGQQVRFSDDRGVNYATINLANAATASLYCYTPHVFNNFPGCTNGTYASYLPTAGSSGMCYTGSYNFYGAFVAWFGSTQSTQAIITYQSQLSETGWTGLTTNDGITGTVGLGRPMESLKIIGDVSYSSYNITTGWQPSVSNGMVSGTVGLGRPIQALKINLGSSLGSQYDVWYHVHENNIGWMGWAQNGATVGVTGSNNDIEAVEIYLSPKGTSPPGSTTNAYQNNGLVNYNPTLSLNVSSHVQNIGWQPQVTNDMISGTIDQSLRVEALKLSLNNNTGLTGGIVYQAHVQNIGWQDSVSDGTVAGTTGQTLRMEAVRMALTGQLGDNYDIWYDTYIQDGGWLGWAKNGQAAGSVGAGLRLEALRILIAPKGTLAIPNQSYLANPINIPIPDTYTISYSTHLTNIGWVTGTTQNAIGGTVGYARPMEALRFDSMNSLFGDFDISCSAYIKGSGWINDIAPGSTCGTTGQSKPIQSIKLQLTGAAASKYDIDYRVHLSDLGWQSWAVNGGQAGIPDGHNIEAVTIKLVQK